ncbi:hypothetical protein L249_4773 [Ophiocordyceps polyrhachis-furcata BCC 54312]|uniref:Uncharacterized protein n=1 Tax=Ophiocordyceps polyrhachis-furcata BCC 54312 TaxID=1330021 RepID=A0A367L2B5_9HYPO|nr:hypothetical protein L249_4773 [Ophiocordyceps polyrhachis-furcata BCC 54312]
MTLKEILDSLRLGLATPSRIKPTHISELDVIAARHYRDTQSPTLTLAGRSLPLIYKIVSTLVSAPWRYAVLVVDVDGSFDATRLTLSCGDDDLAHVYVQRPDENDYGDEEDDADSIRELVVSAQRFMLYNASASLSRHWWGTVVVGGGSRSGGLAGLVDIVAGFNGWLRIEREPVVAPCPPGLDLAEALARREERQRLVDAAAWVASSSWGDFVFSESGGVMKRPAVEGS